MSYAGVVVVAACVVDEYVTLLAHTAYVLDDAFYANTGNTDTYGIDVAYIFHCTSVCDDVNHKDCDEDSSIIVFVDG